MPQAAALAAIASAGVGIAGAAGAFAPDAPEMRMLGDEYRKVLQVKRDFAPSIFADESYYQPLYAGLNSRLMSQNLFGAPATKRTETYQDRIPLTDAELRAEHAARFGNDTRYRVVGHTAQSNLEGGRYRAPSMDTIRADLGDNQFKLQDATRTVDVPASEGMLSLARRVAPELSRIERTADPMLAALIDKLTTEAQSDLNAGSSLTPAEMREAQQSIRAAQSARGMGFGPADVYTEAMTTGAAGRALQDRRRTFAAGVAGLRRHDTGTAGMIGQAGAMGGGGPRMFDPGQDSYANALFAGNNAMANNRNIAGYNSQQGYMGALMGTNWGGIANAFGGGGGGVNVPNSPAWGVTPTWATNSGWRG